MPKNKVPSLRITPYGKADFIRRQDPITRKITPVCKCKYNIDFASGCVFQVPVEQLLEVVEFHGSYSPEHTNQYRESKRWPDERCDYCYEPFNMANIFPRVVDKKTRADFEKYHPKIIRVGKKTEPGHPYYHITLRDVLEICAEEEFQTALIFTTKSLGFNLDSIRESVNYSRGNNPAVYELARSVGMDNREDIPRLLRETSSTLLFSIGWDKAERGASSHGFTNQWRINEAVKFFQYGVNTSLTVVCDLTDSIKNNIRRGSSISEVINAHKRTGINFRLLGLRPENTVAISLCGEPWKDLRQRQRKQNHFDFSKRRYTERADHMAIPNFMHPDFQKLVDSGVGVCGQIGPDENCDECNLYRENSQRIVFPVSEIPKVDFKFKSKRKSKKKEKPEKKEDPDQGKLF